MPFSCFRPGRLDGMPVDALEPPRPVNTKRFMKRQSSAQSRSSSTSNESISKLPPCRRVSDPKVEAMMMPVPPEHRQSRCLRLSQPRTYSNIVDSMKATKGCRDWRNFDVFHADDVDMNVAVEDIARRRRAAFERELSQLKFSSFDSVGSIDEVDMIG